MAFEIPPFEVHIEKWKQEVQMLGYGRTDPPGIHERRMREDNGRYFLEAWNGSEWKKLNEYTANEILQLLLTVDGSGSGLDADKLDGQDIAYLRNASNLNAGTVPQARLSATDILTLLKTVDGSDSGLDADLYRGKKIQWGSVTNAKDTGVLIYFAEAFSSTPKITLTPREEVTTWKTNITTTYCKIYAASTTNKTVDWVAIG